MEALGQGDASYYLMDSRTVFVNPSALNEMKNYVVTEWGTGAAGDSVTAPRAEGGFFREMGAFSYGLYLGNNGTARTVTSASTATFLNHQNALDLVLAGDMGMKWGARVHFANSKDETGGFEKKNSAFGLGLGASHGDLSGYLNLDLNDKSTGAKVVGDEWKRKPGINLGASYKWTGMTFFADYTSTNEDLTAAAGSDITAGGFSSAGAVTAGTASTLTHKTSNVTLGASKMHEVNPGARIVSDARLVLASDEIGGSVVAAQNGKVTTTKLPITFALEADATSWLTLRGSVSQNFILGETKAIDGKKSSITNSATANAGATLNFGKLKVDGVIGTSASARNGALGSTNTGVLTTDNLMSRVGVTYNF
jgi:hypothetical protein